VTNLPFLAHLARYGKPTILSTGMSCLGEVEAAVRTIQQHGNPALAILHCISNYPAEPADVNLRAMHTMATAFQTPVGYSDHTLGISVALAAVALGACIIEKHFTLDRNLPGPDHQASLEPDELVSLIRGIRTVEVSLGHGRKEPTASEANTAAVARKSLVAACDLPAGTILTKDHIVCRRPGTGLPPVICTYLLGRTIRQSVPKGSVFALDMLL
jgi:sialic acid synthase SpsE